MRLAFGVRAAGLKLLSRSVPWLVCSMVVVWANSARAADIWVALSSKEASYAEAADALRASLPGHVVQVRTVEDIQMMASVASLPSPDVLVAVGGEALQRLVRDTSRLQGLPLVAMMTSRNQLDTVRATAGSRVSGVYLDQPFTRQFELIRRAFPSRSKVGLLIGPSSSASRGELAAAARQSGLETVFRSVQEKSEFGDALQDVLADADVLLAVPDPIVFNSQTAKFVLLKAYRRGVPLIAYSASFVKAGAAAAVVSSPAQIGREAAAMVSSALSGRNPPPPRAPEDFEVELNLSVSRSLGLTVDADSLARALRSERGGR